MKAVLVARLLLAVPLLVFGLNGFLHFMEPPGELPAEALSFLGALDATGYLLPLKSGVLVASGAMLLTGLFAPLALILFAPVLVNIVLFHVYLDDPMNGVVGYVLLLLELFLAWAYWPSFRGVVCPSGRTRFERHH